MDQESDRNEFGFSLGRRILSKRWFDEENERRKLQGLPPEPIPCWYPTDEELIKHYKDSQPPSLNKLNYPKS
jgi:hypothetical protein